MYSVVIYCFYISGFLKARRGRIAGHNQECFCPSLREKVTYCPKHCILFSHDRKKAEGGSLVTQRLTASETPLRACTRVHTHTHTHTHTPLPVISAFFFFK